MYACPYYRRAISGLMRPRYGGASRSPQYDLTFTSPA